MPLLYYGYIGPGDDKKKRQTLYSQSLTEIESNVFDSFKLGDLAPLTMLPNVANYWWFETKRHTAFSWHDEIKREHTVFAPLLLGQIQMFEVVRQEFPSIIPSAIVFRINNEYRPFRYG